MQQSAGKHHRTALGHLVAANTELWEFEFTPFKVVVEIDRQRKPAMCRAAGCVVAVGAKVTAVLGVVTPHDVALHPGDLKAASLSNPRRHAPRHTFLDEPPQFGIDNVAIAPLFERVVIDTHRFPIALLHNARFLAPQAFIQGHKTVAQLVLKNVGNLNDRRVHFDAAIARHWW